MPYPHIVEEVTKFPHTSFTRTLVLLTRMVPSGPSHSSHFLKVSPLALAHQESSFNVRILEGHQHLSYSEEYLYSELWHSRSPWAV